MLTIFGLLLAGLAIGVVISSAIFCSVRKETKVYEDYYRKRLEARFREAMTMMTRKAELIIKNVGRSNRVGYYCSCCGLEFPLSNDLPPKEGVIELLSLFRDHADKEHPSKLPEPLPPATA